MLDPETAVRRLTAPGTHGKQVASSPKIPSQPGNLPFAGSDMRMPAAKTTSKFWDANRGVRKCFLLHMPVTAAEAAKRAAGYNSLHR